MFFSHCIFSPAFSGTLFTLKGTNHWLVDDLVSWNAFPGVLAAQQASSSVCTLHSWDWHSEKYLWIEVYHCQSCYSQLSLTWQVKAVITSLVRWRWWQLLLHSVTHDSGLRPTEMDSPGALGSTSLDPIYLVPKGQVPSFLLELLLAPSLPLSFVSLCLRGTLLIVSGASLDKAGDLSAPNLPEGFPQRTLDWHILGNLPFESLPRSFRWSNLDCPCSMPSSPALLCVSCSLTCLLFFSLFLPPWIHILWVNRSPFPCCILMR